MRARLPMVPRRGIPFAERCAMRAVMAATAAMSLAGGLGRRKVERPLLRSARGQMVRFPPTVS